MTSIARSRIEAHIVAFATSAMSNPDVRHGESPALPDLRRLHAFTVVAQELHFRRAAERLGMAQSPLSRMIKGLEDNIGVALFVRSRRSVRLTPAGEAMWTDAKELLGCAERAVDRARSAKSLLAG
jgi:DNA-binding transcriptional LysR family regulator